MFCPKMYHFDWIPKIFTGGIGQACRHPHVKFLCNWMILKFLHKLAYDYWHT